MVIRFLCFQDYFSLLYHLETIKSNGMRRPSWSSAFVVFKTILVAFAIQNQSSLMACGEHHGHPFSLLSRLQGLLLINLMPLMLFLVTGFTDWAFANGRSDGEIARMKLVSLSLLLFYLQ